MTIPSLPPFDIEAAITEPGTRYHRRIDIYESGGTTLWLCGAGLVDGDVSIDMTGDTRRSANLTLFNQGGELDYNRVDGFWYDKVFKVILEVTSSSSTHEQPIGTFLVDRIGNQNARREIDLNFRDFSSKLNFGLPFAVAWPTNHPIEEIIRTLASGGGIPAGQINLPLTGINTGAETILHRRHRPLASHARSRHRQYLRPVLRR